MDLECVYDQSFSESWLTGNHLHVQMLWRCTRLVQELEEKVSALDEREADVTANSKLKEVKQKHISNQPVPVKMFC